MMISRGRSATWRLAVALIISAFLSGVIVGTSGCRQPDEPKTEPVETKPVSVESFRLEASVSPAGLPSAGWHEKVTFQKPCKWVFESNRALLKPQRSIFDGMTLWKWEEVGAGGISRVRRTDLQTLKKDPEMDDEKSLVFLMIVGLDDSALLLDPGSHNWRTEPLAVPFRKELVTTGEETIDGVLTVVKEHKGIKRKFYYGKADGILRKMICYGLFDGKAESQWTLRKLDLNPVIAKDEFRFVPPPGQAVEDEGQRLLKPKKEK